MCQIATEKIFTCLINRGLNSHYNTVVTAIFFKWFSALKHDFHTDIFAYLAKLVCTGCYIY